MDNVTLWYQNKLLYRNHFTIEERFFNYVSTKYIFFNLYILGFHRGIVDLTALVYYLFRSMALINNKVKQVFRNWKNLLTQRNFCGIFQHYRQSCNLHKSRSIHGRVINVITVFTAMIYSNNLFYSGLDVWIRDRWNRGMHAIDCCACPQTEPKDRWIEAKRRILVGSPRLQDTGNYLIIVL